MSYSDTKSYFAVEDVKLVGNSSGLSNQETNESSSTGHIASLISNGLLSLIIRQVGVNGALFVGNVLLSRLVTPEIYGIFAVVLAFQTSLIIFADCGLGPALIQRNHRPSQEEIVGLFTVQFALFSIFATGVWFLAPWLVTLVNISSEAEVVIRSCSIILCITALRSIPALLLERDLRFGPIVMAEVVGTIVYQTVLLTLIWIKFGIISIVYALIARYTCDLLIVWFFNPWKPNFSLNLKPIMPYLRFGINMQGVRLMAYAKDQLPLLLLVPLFGAASAGIWGWSMTYVAMPIYMIRLVERVMFPAFARVQHDREKLGELVTNALWLTFSIGVPFLFILVSFAPFIIERIYGDVWLVTVPVVYLLALNIAGGFMTAIFFNFLYGIGESAKAFHIFALWVVITSALAMPAMFAWNLAGTAAAYSIATLIICLILFYVISPKVTINWGYIFGGCSLAVIAASITKILLSYSSLETPIALLLVSMIYTITFCIKDRSILLAFLQRRLISI